MKTEKYLKDHIEKIAHECFHEREENAIKVLKDRMAFAKNCLLYIQTNPSEEFLAKEIDRISNRVNMLMKSYVALNETKNSVGDCLKHKKDYEKEMGIPHLRKRLSTLNFLNN